jgi:syntaxin 5
MLLSKAKLFTELMGKIQELTYIIKQDIAALNRQISALQTHVKQRAGRSESKLVDEHESNVVLLLQSKLANASMTFKDVLEIRTQVRLAVRTGFVVSVDIFRTIITPRT